MKFLTFLLALSAALGASANAASKKPTVTVRFHAEANAQDGSSFAMPAKLEYQRREAHLSRVPAFSERQIKAIYPFPAAVNDGTWGCTFVLDPQGRIRLETMSTEQRGTALVLFVGTKNGQHQVIDMLIDRPVTNGMITVPRGLTPAEVVVLKTQFPVLGEEVKGRKKPEKKKEEDITNWQLDRNRDAPARPADGNAAPIARPVVPAVPDAPRAQRRVPRPDDARLRELDLPRVGD